MVGVRGSKEELRLLFNFDQQWKKDILRGSLKQLCFKVGDFGNHRKCVLELEQERCDGIAQCFQSRRKRRDQIACWELQAF